eukprot:CAMPEP_0204276040 /NCGR_PEP_ID=MMETSP0468-20130131/27222_1 /ASSEMBLY_ACC=CAM_ASM_000383 /TAXON_ID=2969 /ORGANISM="Oxyrrhis marina" /LENGTH=121 /DNA_ID=CAMNT_0051252541 /DNA_START=27 /DNA_END=392 /DNA_ORIENTATION=-
MDDTAGEETIWESDAIAKLIEETIESVLKPSEVYADEEVPHWINAILEELIRRLNDAKKPYKYLCSCMIMQRNGAGMHSATSAFWDAVNDGSVTHVWPREKSKDQVNKTMYCICTVGFLEY